MKKIIIVLLRFINSIIRKILDLVYNIKFLNRVHSRLFLLRWRLSEKIVELEYGSITNFLNSEDFKSILNALSNNKEEI